MVSQKASSKARATHPAWLSIESRTVFHSSDVLFEEIRDTVDSLNSVSGSATSNYETLGICSQIEGFPTGSKPMSIMFGCSEAQRENPQTSCFSATDHFEPMRDLSSDLRFSQSGRAQREVPEGHGPSLCLWLRRLPALRPSVLRFVGSARLGQDGRDDRVLRWFLVGCSLLLSLVWF